MLDEQVVGFLAEFLQFPVVLTLGVEKEVFLVSPCFQDDVGKAGYVFTDGNDLLQMLQVPPVDSHQPDHEEESEEIPEHHFAAKTFFEQRHDGNQYTPIITKRNALPGFRNI